jgi:hypothetical protein
MPPAKLEEQTSLPASKPDGQWDSLLPYLDDGRLEIDTNLVENAIRPTTVGKKNWLFMGEANAGDRSAIIYTIIESCRRRGIDPYAYLRDVFTRLSAATNWQIKDLTPQGLGQGPASHTASTRSVSHTRRGAH